MEKREIFHDYGVKLNKEAMDRYAEQGYSRSDIRYATVADYSDLMIRIPASLQEKYSEELENIAYFIYEYLDEMFDSDSPAAVEIHWI